MRQDTEPAEMGLPQEAAGGGARHLRVNRGGARGGGIFTMVDSPSSGGCLCSRVTAPTSFIPSSLLRVSLCVNVVIRPSPRADTHDGEPH